MINGMVGVRGDPNFYARLVNEFGLTGWDYYSLLPLFKRIENDLIPGQDPFYHGYGGLIDSDTAYYVVNGAPQFLAAGANATFANNDFNGPLGLNGFGLLPFFQSPNPIYVRTRNNTYFGYLLPILNNPRLNVITQAQVLKVLLNRNNHAYGVTFLHNSEFGTAFARYEIILCAGTLRTPTILLNSGIGPSEDLTALGIEVLVNSPNVGKGYQDHFFLTYRAVNNCPVPPSDYPLLLYTTLDPICGWINSSYSPGYADIYLSFNDIGYRPVTTQFFLDQFSINIQLGAPQARGNVTLFSNNPLDPPQIDFNYSPSGTDLQVMVEAWNFLQNNILSNPTFAACIAPGPQITPAPGQDLISYIQAETWSTLHPTSSCSMGVNSDSCLDSQLRVRGVSGLRVADDSVWPVCPNGNTQLPATVVAEKASELLIAQYTPSNY